MRNPLFYLPPEEAHDLVLKVLKIVDMFPPARGLLRLIFETKSKEVKACGLTFPNVIGLAAGFDKNAVAYRTLSCFGFGHIEVGTITLKPQAGNIKPRIFRFEKQKAIVNHMGFPNDGAIKILKRLKKKTKTIIGASIGKQADTSLFWAHCDYKILMELIAPYVDYISINISSPNTEGLRNLHNKEYLGPLLDCLVGRTIPLFLKVSPDLYDSELEEVLDTAKNRIDGIIATNTSKGYFINGGISGEPIKNLSTRIVTKICRETDIPVIASGGIFSADDVKEKLDAGAKLVQVYTGFIYNGPFMIKKILRNLNETYYKEAR